jgi:hypothetical protein
MLVDELYPSRFLKAVDLNGRPTRVIIDGVTQEELNGQPKVIMSFTNAKSLVLNKTNARLISRLHGPDTAAWSGKDIVLVPAMIDFKGESVPGIRIRAATARPSQPQVKTMVEPDDVPFDDDVPFGAD